MSNNSPSNPPNRSWSSQTNSTDQKTVDWSGIVDNVFKEEIGKYAMDLNTHSKKK